MNPPEPGPVSGLSATQETNAAATAASMAFPPSARMRAPASAVRGWPAAIAPFIQGNVLRVRQTNGPLSRQGTTLKPAQTEISSLASRRTLAAAALFLAAV